MTDCLLRSFSDLKRQTELHYLGWAKNNNKQNPNWCHHPLISSCHAKSNPQRKKTKRKWIQNFLYCPVAGSLTLTGSGTKVYPGPYPSLLYLHSERGSLLKKSPIKSPIKSETVNGNHSIVSLLIKLCFLFWFLLFWFLSSLFFSAAFVKASCWVIYSWTNVSFIPYFGLLVFGILVTLVAWFFSPLFSRLAHLALQNVNKDYIIFSHFCNFIAISDQKPKTKNGMNET